MTSRLAHVSQLCVWRFSVAAVSGVMPVSGALAAPAKTAATWSYQLDSHFEYRDDSGAPGPQQSIRGKVLASGDKARMESSVGGRPVVLIVAPPYFYKILPAAKSGRRYKLSEVAPLHGVSEIVPQNWMRDPESLRGMLKKQGAKPAGSETVDGVVLEVWTGSQFLGQAGALKAWLRRTDALPVRVEVNAKHPAPPNY